MKRNLLTLLIMTVISSLLSFPASANAEKTPTFQLTTIVASNNQVVVSMTGKNVVDLYGYEARFTFDSHHLELVETTSTLGGFSISPKINSNEIVIAHTKTGNVLGKSGDFVIGTLTFKYKQLGQSTVAWKSIKAVDHNLGYQTHSLMESASVSSARLETPPNVLGSVDVSKQELNNNKDGKVIIEIADGKQTVLLPAKAAEIIGNNKLELKFKDLSVFLPVEVLKSLQDLLSFDEMEDAKISFSFNKVSLEVKNDLLTKASNKAKAKITANGDIIDYSLCIITAKGKVQTLTTFNQPIKVKLKVNYSAQSSLLGHYFITDSGELEYAGGLIAEGYMTAEISHFSKYAVLSYDKSFDDVADTHWAILAIKELAAKHVVNGVNDTQFLPNANITRAEFAAFVVRALGLKAAGISSFADVSNKAWYASFVTAAEETGIITGRGEFAFAPNETITREEMAAIIVRAYQYKTGIHATAEQHTTFTDVKEISSWAKTDVNTAFELGLISGRGDGHFAPKEWSTRAESSQIIVNLLKKL
jgi:hypothetical protein